MNISLPQLNRYKCASFLSMLLCASFIPNISTELGAHYPLHQTIEQHKTEKTVDQLLLLIQKRLVINLSFEFFCSFDCVKASEMNK